YAWTGPLNFAGSGRAPSINNTTINNAGKYFVTVTSDKGCVQKDSTSVTINKLPSISVSPTAITMCEGESKVLNAVGVNVLSYLWQPSAGLSANNIAAPAASPKDSTTYTLIASNGSCAATATVAVNILKKPLANAGPDKNLFEGSTVQLNGTAQSTNISYNWSPDGSLKGASTLTPVASPNADITYTLRVTSNSGCGTSSDDVIVKVFKNLVVPNAFSPNGDGVNDTWIIQHLGEYNNAEITVFNRYGNPVFTSRGVYKPWNGTYDKGKVLPTGTYYYIIDLKMVKVKYTGWLLIIK
ncbi:MAG TPA: gliding motility-associated C-terminal domain-containing protein, partial [Segetibacter sp.]